MAYRLVDARYDVTNPLTEVQNPGTQPFVTNIAYTIDGLGNRSQVATTPPTPPTQVMYANDVVNQYTSVGGTTRSHDNNGNLTDDGTYKFVYDFENRLVELRNSTTNALIASYRYDALGRRVEKALNGGATTRYVLDGVQAVEEFDGSNAWQARYVYEDGIDQPRCMDRADIADVNGNSNTTEVLRFHYHQQALGSVTELTQPSGAVVEWVTYDVYGLPTIRNQVGTTVSQSAVGNPWLYTGREYEPESGLYFYRARTYDPVTGRFLQRDPLGPSSGSSLHEYVCSAPPSYTDPTGLHPKPIKITYTKSSKSGAAGAAENKQRAKDAVAKYKKEHPKAIIPAGTGSGIGTPIKWDPQKTPIRWAKGSTTWGIRVRAKFCYDAQNRYQGSQYIYTHAYPPIVVVPSDGSVDAHEEGHVEIVNKQVDEANAAEGGEVYDGGIHDDPEKVADRKQENINKRAKKEHDKYDDATDHGATQGNRSR